MGSRLTLFSKTMFRAFLIAAVIGTCLGQNFQKVIFPASQKTVNFFRPQANQKRVNTVSSFNRPQARFISRPSKQSRVVISESRQESKDVFEETRSQANMVKSTLKKLAANNKASKYMKRIFIAGDCLQDVEEAIDAIEQGVTIIESAEPELRKLISSVSSIDNTTDLADVTRTSAQLLRQMETVLPKLAPPRNDVCGSSFNTASKTMEAVGNILKAISDDETLELSKLTQLELQISKVIVDSINTFLGELRDIFADLKTECTSHRGYNVRSFGAIGKMLEGLADLFKNLGDTPTSKKIREKVNLTKKISATIETFPEINFEKLDCNAPGDFETSATLLEDLANIIEEVGLEKLQKQLGVEDLITV